MTKPPGPDWAAQAGLVWLANANCLSLDATGGEVDWNTAMEFVAGLGDTGTGATAFIDDCGLSDNSSPGEWRLPSAAELYEMFLGPGPGAPNCVPVLTNEVGDGCWSDGGSSFTGVETIYWASTPDS